MVPLYTKIVIIAVFFGVGLLLAIKFASKITQENRAAEWPENDKAEPLTPTQRDWQIVHIRDDLGGIYLLLVLANGFLAGILGALVAALL